MLEYIALQSHFIKQDILDLIMIERKWQNPYSTGQIPRTSDSVSVFAIQSPLSFARSNRFPETKPNGLSQMDTMQSVMSPVVDRPLVSWQATQIAVQAKGSAMDLCKLSHLSRPRHDLVKALRSTSPSVGHRLLTSSRERATKELR